MLQPSPSPTAARDQQLHQVQSQDSGTKGSQADWASPAPRLHTPSEHTSTAALHGQLSPKMQESRDSRTSILWRCSPQHFLSLLPHPGCFSSHPSLLPGRHASAWKYQELATGIPSHRACQVRITPCTLSTRRGEMVLKHFILPLTFYLRDTFISHIYKLTKA